jgi:DegV family protein with EDD domain
MDLKPMAVGSILCNLEETLMSIRLVVDSSADIELDVAAKHHIVVVPLTISFGDETFYDRTEMSPATFYQRLEVSHELPKTSLPSISQFVEAYHQLIAEGATTIISAHLSIHFSGTYNAARMAAEEVSSITGIPIHVIDTHTVSAAISAPALQASAMIDEGASLEDILSYFDYTWQHGRVFILLDSLTNLERTGRIGRAKAVLGSILKIKPILTFQDGVVTLFEQVRTRSKAMTRLCQIIESYKPIKMLALVSSDPQTGSEFLSLIQSVYDGPIEKFTFGPVVGLHAGTHSGGIYVLPER